MTRTLWLPLALSVAALCGCYETDMPVLDGGERLPLAGRYQCTVHEKPVDVAYSENRGAPPPLLGSSESYSYRSDNGEVLQGKKVGGSLFIVQTLLKNSNGGVVLMFYELLPGGFLILEERYPEVEALAARHQVKLTSDGPNYKIAGNATDILTFLMDHDGSSLTVTGRCSVEN
jgi:hypothetical protein